MEEWAILRVGKSLLACPRPQRSSNSEIIAVGSKEYILEMERRLNNKNDDLKLSNGSDTEELFSSEHSDYYPSSESESESDISLSDSENTRPRKKQYAVESNDSDRDEPFDGDHPKYDPPSKLDNSSTDAEDSLQSYNLELDDTVIIAPPSEDDNITSTSNSDAHKSSNERPQLPDSTTSDLKNAGYNFEKRCHLNEKNSSENVIIPYSNNIKGRRVYDKQFSCLFCGKLYVKLPQHLERCHANERDVYEFTKLQKNSLERKQKLLLLTNKGNFLHNEEVLKSNEGTLLISRRPPKNSQIRSATDFLPCEHCLGYFYRKELHRHVKKCFARDKLKIYHRNRVQATALMMLPSRNSDTVYLKEILSTMTVDNIRFQIINDNVLMEFGKKLAMKHRLTPHMAQDIRQTLRQVARLTLFINATNPHLKYVADILMPSNFNILIEGVKNMCLDSGAEKASLALKLGHSLKKCAGVIKVAAMMKRDNVMKKEMDHYLELHAIEWNNQISSAACTIRETNKWNKPSLLPLAEDILTFNKYIYAELEKYIAADLSDVDYRELVHLTMAFIISFNRRRSGEIEKLQKDVFENRLQPQTATEVYEGLTEAEKILVSKLHRIETRGKRGRKVPILLTPDMCEALDIIIKIRERAGVLKENKYMFAAPKSLYPIRGCDAIRIISKASGAKNPDSLRSTKLRKHIATVSQVLNLKDNELDSLAQFMGHDINVHRNFYRLPENTIQLAKISKILINISEGKTSLMKGKNLDEIDLYLSGNDAGDNNDDSEDNGHADENNNQAVINEIESENSCGSMTEEYPRPVKKSRLSKSSLESDIKLIKRSCSVKVQNKRIPWTDEEMAAVKKYFARNILNADIPGKNDCEKCKCANPVLDRREWKQVKYCVYNLIKGRKKN